MGVSLAKVPNANARRFSQPIGTRRGSTLAILTSAPIGLGAVIMLGSCSPFGTAIDAGARDAQATNEMDASGADAGGAAQRLVQQKSGSGSNVTFLDLTLPNAPASGDALILAVNSTGTGTEYPVTVTGGGVTWAVVSHSAVHEDHSLWAGFASGSAQATVRLSWSSSQPAAVAHLSEWAGLSAFDASATNSAETSLVSTAASNVVQPGELVFATAGLHAIDVMSPSDGFMPLDAVTVVAGDVKLVQAYRFSSSTGTLSTSWQQASPSDAWDTQIASFRH
jgi:hypothetical protein